MAVATSALRAAKSAASPAASAPSKPLIDPRLARMAESPPLIAVAEVSERPRVTASHAHAAGQLLGAVRGLLSIGGDTGHWVVPAIHAVWIPPDHAHSLHSHGAFVGWSVYIAPAACTALPDQMIAIRMSGLLREAVARAATWTSLARDSTREHIADVILDEIRDLPREPLGLPMPSDPRLARIAHALADDPADPRSHAAWAAWAGVTPRTLTRRFPLETGFRFTEWRQRARLLRSLEFLAMGTPVTTIALELGYDSVSAFIALFRRTFGVTPSKYATLPPRR